MRWCACSHMYARVPESSACCGAAWPDPASGRVFTRKLVCRRTLDFIRLGSIAHDPGNTSLRRGLRAALVVPLVLGASTLLALPPDGTMFLVFGTMALLVFADFGGATRERVGAYFVTALAGIPLIVVGTLASTSTWMAVAASAQCRARDCGCRCAGRLLPECANSPAGAVRARGDHRWLHRRSRHEPRWLGSGRRCCRAGRRAPLAPLQPPGAARCGRLGASGGCGDSCRGGPGQERGIFTTRDDGPPGLGSTSSRFCGGAATALRRDLAEEIRSGGELRVTGIHDTAAELRRAALSSLSQPDLATSPPALRSAIGLVSAVQWLGQLDRLLLDLKDPLPEAFGTHASHRA